MKNLFNFAPKSFFSRKEKVTGITERGKEIICDVRKLDNFLTACAERDKAKKETKELDSLGSSSGIKIPEMVEKNEKGKIGMLEEKELRAAGVMRQKDNNIMDQEVPKISDPVLMPEPSKITGKSKESESKENKVKISNEVKKPVEEQKPSSSTITTAQKIKDSNKKNSKLKKEKESALAN